MPLKLTVTNLPAVQRRLKALTGGLTQSEASEVGRKAVQAMKDLISAGLSPVRGGGYSTRFPAYKNPEKYPGRRKAHSPVNLYLTGKMLAALTYQVVSSSRNGYGTQIGYFQRSEELKEEGHREGTNGQPSRPTLPQYENGERFAATIEDAYLQVILRAVAQRT